MRYGAVKLSFSLIGLSLFFLSEHSEAVEPRFITGIPLKMAQRTPKEFTASAAAATAQARRQAIIQSDTWLSGSHTEVLGSHYALPFISTAPRTSVSASSQMEHFRQACDAQRQRPLWQLQQANYGSCVFAVRFRPSLVPAIAPRHFCSMLPEQHALSHL